MTSRVLRTSDGRYAGSLPAAPPSSTPPPAIAPLEEGHLPAPAAPAALAQTYQRYLQTRPRTWTPDPATVELYTDRDCWLLARHLHEQSGWPYAAIIDEAVDADNNLVHHVADAHRVGWFHVGVLTPDGDFLDVTGTHDRSSALNDWADRADPDSGWGGDLDIAVFDCATYSQMLSLPADGTDGQPDQDTSWAQRHTHARATAGARLSTLPTTGTPCPRCR